MGGSAESHANPDLAQQTAGNGGKQRSGCPYKEINHSQKVGAGGSAYTIGDGAAQGNAPNGGGA